MNGSISHFFPRMKCFRQICRENQSTF